MTVAEHLRAARELISDESRWCQKAVARDSDGEAVSVHSPRAVQWCVNGALEKVVPAGTSVFNTRIRLGECIPADVLVYSIHRYNDHPDTTHEDILNWFDSAISWSSIDMA